MRPWPTPTSLLSVRFHEASTSHRRPRPLSRNARLHEGVLCIRSPRSPGTVQVEARLRDGTAMLCGAHAERPHDLPRTDSRRRPFPLCRAASRSASGCCFARLWHPPHPRLAVPGEPWPPGKGSTLTPRVATSSWADGIPHGCSGFSNRAPGRRQHGLRWTATLEQTRMDILCTCCGEPWDVYHVLHESPEGFTRHGCLITACPCCLGKRPMQHQPLRPP
jgi:hypothetical protein